MFENSCRKIRESVYGFRGKTRNGNQLISSTGTAFMIAPGLIVTTSHSLYLNGKTVGGLHQKFDVIRSPDIGQECEDASLIAEDVKRDLALLKISNPRSQVCVKLNTSGRIPSGTPCGSLGFPLSRVTGKNWILVERFQGAHISAYHRTDKMLFIYETDSPMYSGASGCPGFLEHGEVFGLMQATQRSGRMNNSAIALDIDSHRLAIAMWVPSGDIIDFAAKNGISIS